jgi:hypothetical protein
MRRYQSLGLGVFSALFCASMIAACSASGNDPTVASGGPAAGDSGAAGDGSYNYGDSGSNLPTEDGSTSTPYDAGSTAPFDAGPPPPPSNDCDLSGSNASTYITELGGSLPPCGTADACGTGMCCLNVTGSIPASFAAVLAALGGGSLPAPGCVAQ